MNGWLLSESAIQMIREAREMSRAPTPEEVAALSARRAEVSDSAPRNLVVAGDAAEIAVTGVLTKDPSFWMEFLGIENTAYSDIIAALAVADSDPAVRRVVLNIDSPGGSVDGFFDTLAALEATRKPITARASMACSGAYGIACMASKIEAKNRAASFGSVGVAATYLVDPAEVTITSTNAPDKRPDPATPEGKAVLRAHLDAIHDLFVDAIARGRRTTVMRVNEDFGRGATLLADEAKARGMIDGVFKPRVVRVDGDASATVVGDAPVAETISHLRDAEDQKQRPETGKKEKIMNLEELREKHPELYKEAVAVGVSRERSRVCAHLTMGVKSGAVDKCHAFIRDGKSSQDDETVAEYLSAGMSRADTASRQAEADVAGAAVEGAPAGDPSAPDMGDLVAARIIPGYKPKT